MLISVATKRKSKKSGGANEELRSRPRKKLESGKAADEDRPPYFELWQALSEMLKDLDAYSRVRDAIALKCGEIFSTGAWPPSRSLAEEVRRSVNVLPSVRSLANEFSQSELESMAVVTEQALKYWTSELSKPSSTIPETLRRRQRHVAATVRVPAVSATPDRSADQQFADIASDLQVSVEHLKRLWREGPSIKGGVIAALTEIERMRPGVSLATLRAKRK